MSRMYAVGVPDDLYDEIRRIADRHDISVLDFMQKAIKIGVGARQHAEQPTR